MIKISGKNDFKIFGKTMDKPMACAVRYSEIGDKEEFDRVWCMGLSIRPLYRMRLIAMYECIDKEVNCLYIENYSDLFFKDDEYSKDIARYHCIIDGLTLCNSGKAKEISNSGKVDRAWRCAEIIFIEWQVAT